MGRQPSSGPVALPFVNESMAAHMLYEVSRLHESMAAHMLYEVSRLHETPSMDITTLNRSISYNAENVFIINIKPEIAVHER